MFVFMKRVGTNAATRVRVGSPTWLECFHLMIRLGNVRNPGRFSTRWEGSRCKDKVEQQVSSGVPTSA